MSKPSDSARDLLFGLLALQNGLIDQGGLFTAFAAWIRDKGRPLADHLVELGYLDAPRRSVVDAIAGLHIQALGGDPGKSLAVLSIGPSICEKLVRAGGPEVEATLGHVGSGHGSTNNDDDPERTGAYFLGSATSDGQRFRILRPHARGGLGAVFVALDGELHREVALKQILEQHADDEISRQRFVAEAEITGGLEHPGVVPVYGLGTDAGGRPYYAMRFIKGDSLKEAIDRFQKDQGLRKDAGRRSLELRTLLRRFTDVCNAIDYAHSRGVIHRDIKPANIIVGKHGETLVVDWGLAKAIGRADPSGGEQTIAPSASGSSETVPGSALGTPAYMSPEQSRGELDRLGPRSDVYSLGATLYCLLTGKPPFEGEDIGEVLRSVQEGKVRRPSLVDPSLDRALEAICLKALATQIEDRYKTPRALADDLERWMADEPVTAWREPFARQARRWAKRNRTAVTAAAAALVAGVVGLSAVLAVQSRAKADIARSLASETQANAALAGSNKELTRSQAAVEARYNLAVDAIKTFHTGVSEDFLLKQDQFKDLRNRLLKSAADFYGKLGALLGKDKDLASRQALAASNFELATLTGKVGRPLDALAAHRAVLAAREALASDPGADAQTKADVGRSLRAVASLLDSTGKVGEAEVTLRHAEDLLAGPARSDPAARAALAACRSRLGELLNETGKPTDALEAYQRARADQEALANAPGSTIEARRDLADTIGSIGSVLYATGNLAGAEVEMRAALAIRARLANENPGLLEFRCKLADSHKDLLDMLYYANNRRSDMAAEARKAIAIYQKLADENPAVVEFRSRLADTHTTVAAFKAQDTNLADEAVVRAAMTIYQRLVDENPAVIKFRRQLALTHEMLGFSLVSGKRLLDGGGRVPRGDGDVSEACRREPYGERYSLVAGKRTQQLRLSIVGVGPGVRRRGRVPRGDTALAEASRRTPDGDCLPHPTWRHPQRLRQCATRDVPPTGSRCRAPRGARDPPKAGERAPHTRLSPG